MKQRIVPAILSGGSGTRLWPSSTEAKPKQFHALLGGASLFAETLARASGETDALIFAPPIVLAAERHRALVRAGLGARAEDSTIVLEPCARNTAAIAAVAAALTLERAPGALVLLLPADHIIVDRDAFMAALAAAAPVARTHIVTFGVKPTRPETGYGYIKSGAALAPGVFEIEAFQEKPDAATAEAYVKSGGYSWNAGMFLFDPALLLAEFAPAADIRDAALEALAKARRNGPEIALDEAAFARAPALPLDVAVMEKTQRGAVAPCDMGWADLGAWDEIWRLSPKDGAGNSVQGETALLEATNCLVRGEGVRVCAAGVNDLVIIATPEAVLILPRERAQDVKRLKALLGRPS